jgi:hypothetical protein
VVVNPSDHKTIIRQSLEARGHLVGFRKSTFPLGELQSFILAHFSDAQQQPAHCFHSGLNLFEIYAKNPFI